MGLTLILLRHAKSSHDPALADVDRPLNTRGLREAEWAAEELANHAARPALVLCSPARRTHQTLDALHDWLGDAPIAFEKRIYQASAQSLLLLLHEQTPDSILMIGHNPGFENLARTLSGEGDPAALHRLARKYPPAGMATIAFNAKSWADVGPASGRLMRFETPGD